MDRDAECKEAIETGGARSVDRRPPLPEGWGPTIRSSASSRSLARPPSNNQSSTRSLPEGWVNTDTIRSIIQLGGHDTLKSILSLPRGEDGFIHRQVRAQAVGTQTQRNVLQHDAVCPPCGPAAP